MLRIWVGTVLVIAGIAAFIEARTHRPIPPGYFTPHVPGAPSRLSQTGYDLLRIGAWALVIVGGLVVVTGLIRYWVRQTGGSLGAA